MVFKVLRGKSNGSSSSTSFLTDIEKVSLWNAVKYVFNKFYQIPTLWQVLDQRPDIHDKLDTAPSLQGLTSFLYYFSPIISTAIQHLSL